MERITPEEKERRKRIAEWLKREMDIKRWSKTETARRAGVARSNYINASNERLTLSIEALEMLADAFGVSREIVYKLDGRLPLVTPEDEAIARIVADVQTMDPEDQAEIAEYIRFKREQAEGKKNGMRERVV